MSHDKIIKAIQSKSMIGGFQYLESSGFIQFASGFLDVVGVKEHPEAGHAMDLKEFCHLLAGEKNQLAELELEALIKSCKTSSYSFFRSKPSGGVMEFELSMTLDEIGAIGVLKNTTQREQEKSRALLANEYTGVGIWDWNIIEGSLIWDSNMYEMYEMPKDFSGDKYSFWESSLLEEGKEKLLKELEAALSGQEKFDTEFRIGLNSGVKFIKAVGKVFFGFNGKPYRMIGVNMDVSIQKKTEALYQQQKQKAADTAKLALIGEMAAGVAHEINNPLALIDLQSQLLLRRKNFEDEESTVNSIEKIQQACDRASNIVKKMKKLSRSGVDQEREEVGAHHLVRESEVYFSEKLKNWGIDYQVELKTDFSTRCNLLEISQVLINLVNNAADEIQYRKMDEKWIKISIDATSDGTGSISVIDPGGGISTETQELLFNSFYTTKPIGKGTGLGLSISANITEDHGGKLFVSDECETTCFTLELPIVY